MRQDESQTDRSVISREDVEEEITNRRQKRIDAYPTAWRLAIDQIARKSSAFEDLTDSFPGLLFALATGYAVLSSDAEQNPKSR